MGQRRAVTNRLATKYRQATRPEKSEILDQLVELTGWHRDHARAQLRQAGTVRFGTDPATSVLDTDCKAHEVDNLYVVDTSFFPSIGAVNPALTAIANALRVGDHLTARLG